MAGASVMKEEVQPHWDASFSGESRRDVQGSLLLSSSSLPSVYPIGCIESEVINKCINSCPLERRCQDGFRNSIDLTEHQ